MRRARHCPRLARPRRLRRQRASPRLVAAALRASPVSASPSTGSRSARCTIRRTGAVARALAPAERARTSLRTAPGSRVHMTADSTASASGSVLRTTARGSGRIARHSVAVAAPLRRVPRRRFPHRSSSDSQLSGRHSAFRLHTPRIVDAGVPWGSMPCPCGAFRCQRGPCGCWSERVARETRGSSPPWPRMAPRAPPRNSCATRRVSDCVSRVPLETRASCV